MSFGRGSEGLGFFPTAINKIEGKANQSFSLLYTLFPIKIFFFPIRDYIYE